MFNTCAPHTSTQSRARAAAATLTAFAFSCEYFSILFCFAFVYCCSRAFIFFPYCHSLPTHCQRMDENIFFQNSQFGGKYLFLHVMRQTQKLSTPFTFLWRWRSHQQIVFIYVLANEGCQWQNFGAKTAANFFFQCNFNTFLRRVWGS